MNFSLSVVIPAYNEEGRVKKTLELVLSYLKKRVDDFEIIIVNDGSTDNTSKILNSFKQNNQDQSVIILNNRSNRGKGFSIKKGIMKSTKEYVLFADADNSTPISELSKFIRLTKKYDVLIASRNLKKSKIKKQPFYRRFPGKIFPLLVNLLLIPGVGDTQCGFKLFKTEHAKKIFSKQKIVGWAFDAEALFIAGKLGYSVKEVPVRWVNDTNSKLNLFRDSFSMLFELFRIRLNNLRGVYD